MWASHNLNWNKNVSFFILCGSFKPQKLWQEVQTSHWYLLGLDKWSTSETMLLLTYHAVLCEMLFWEWIMIRAAWLVPILVILVFWQHLQCQGEREMLFSVLRNSWTKGKKSCHLVWGTETALNEVKLWDIQKILMPLETPSVKMISFLVTGSILAFCLFSTNTNKSLCP